jgi:hypothetical protein
MNNKKRIHFFATSFLLLGFIFVPHFVSSNQNISTLNFQLTIPKVSLDLSQLEVRDSQNRVVKSHLAKVQLEFLFVQSLNRMLMNNLTPGQVEKLRTFTLLFQTFVQFAKAAQATVVRVAGYISELRKKTASINMWRLALSLRPPLSLQAWREASTMSSISDVLSSTVLRR